ncbi:ubiquinol-cytochrome c reductase iron-sulfur subunit [Cohnella lubricantis]|uniref:Ubiquinol-cytochrome c reductase iron-sulfur subunit n=1 Tax=Cohnella lubricantis TaxID=2163172 RepID=A0A841TGT7_9BACL|nr:ubiquinol-cytochrome c reductase iron-sulfur subunit [Cohnella lubricantis]MBB6679596.1 ubiquinol-cytochrome c reductase iron-sulfur subunit [Cohnella lubricantis]MBP2119936.1 menaquinol-cytochrome c reductase iron-sulfur subunit [Cohnella lubricantis]
MDHNEQQETAHKPIKRNEMTRRQFLSYTLGGATAFMGMGAVLPMLRFAVDPLLQKKQSGDFIKVIEESKVTSDPQQVDFQVHQVDGWYESDPKMEAYIAKGSDGQVFALSPICKHLGCTISWSGAEAPDLYHCPCHGAQYSKDGKNLKVAPKPLDEYQVKIENGWVYLGPLQANTRV